MNASKAFWFWLFIAALTVTVSLKFHQQRLNITVNLMIKAAHQSLVMHRERLSDNSSLSDIKRLFAENSNRCHTGFWEAKQMTGYWAVNSTADDGRLAICPLCVWVPATLAWFEIGCFWECPSKSSSGMERESTTTSIHSILLRWND